MIAVLAGLAVAAAAYAVAYATVWVRWRELERRRRDERAAVRRIVEAELDSRMRRLRLHVTSVQAPAPTSPAASSPGREESVDAQPLPRSEAGAA